MNKAYVKLVEKELYDYRKSINMISEIQEDILGDSAVHYSHDQVASGSGISVPTERKAINLATNTLLKRLIRTVDALERAISNMDENEHKVYELYYESQISWEDIISIHLPMGRATFYRYKKNIIYKVAHEMGLPIE